MKEGYLQRKIAELNERCQRIDEMISLEKANVELLQEQVGGFKQLLKKLKDVEEFRKQVLMDITKRNREEMDLLLEKMAREIEKTVNKTLKYKTSDINKLLVELKDLREELLDKMEVIKRIEESTQYLLESQHFLMLRLMNKGILSNRDVSDIERRAKKTLKH